MSLFKIYSLPQTEKKDAEKKEKEIEAKGIVIPLLPEAESDTTEAKSVEFTQSSWAGKRKSMEQDLMKRKLEIKSRPIFSSSASAAHSSSKLQLMLQQSKTNPLSKLSITNSATKTTSRLLKPSLTTQVSVFKS